MMKDGQKMIRMVALVFAAFMILEVIDSVHATAPTPPYYVYVKFEAPYSNKSGWYPIGSEIELERDLGMDITLSLKLDSDSGAYESLIYWYVIPVTNTLTTDYCCNNAWVFLVALAALMAYRFFSGRAMDFQDAWDELMGKK
ncbi:MAG: hypothetical protein ABIH11_02980 [Candidatus Altiarchaeota archaeon]